MMFGLKQFQVFALKGTKNVSKKDCLSPTFQDHNYSETKLLDNNQTSLENAEHGQLHKENEIY